MHNLLVAARKPQRGKNQTKSGQEFRESVYKKPFAKLRFPAPGVKGAMATAALETDGITKTSVQRRSFYRKPTCKSGVSPG